MAPAADSHADDSAQQQEVQQALDHICSSEEAQRQALQRALDLTSPALGGQGADGGSSGSTADGHAAGGAIAADEERRRWWLAARLRVLQHIERLDTTLALHGGVWHPQAYAALRSCTVAEAASALARAGRLAALPLLLQRHPHALLPSLLDVLACIPETVDAKQYAPLLRRVVALRQPPPLPRPADWAESTATAAALREQGQYALLLATEPMAAVSSGWHPPTPRQLAAWACERAQQLDAATGQLPNAVALLEAAQAALHYGEPSIGTLLATAQELLSLLKLAASRGEGGTWRMELRQYAGLSPSQRLSLLLGLLGSDSLASDLVQQVAPFLSRLGGIGSSGGSSGGSEHAAVDPQIVLRQALEQEAARRLPWVVRLVQCEARQRCVFSSAAQLAKTAAACCYACTATDAWELLTSMLNVARDSVQSDAQLAPEQRQASQDALEMVGGHVTAARLLTKHGLTTPISMVRDSDRAAALRLLRTLLARVSRTKNSESRWVEVWMDLRRMAGEHGFTQLSEADVRTELCRALLRVGQYRLSGSYLGGLPAAAAEQLVLAAGKEVYLSASGMGDRAVKQAKECLALLPGSEAVQEQLAAIAAAEHLHQLGLDLPPLQLQQLQARAASGNSAVLEQLLAEHPQLVAADGSALGQLAAALGIAQQQQPLLLGAAEAAHAAEDRPRAQSLLLVLAGQHYRPAWRLAAAVAAEPTTNTNARRRLLVFALCAAPPEELLPLLLQWQAADSAAGGGRAASCWDLFSAAESASSASSPHEQQRQQQWLEQQLRGYLSGLGGSAGGLNGEAAALGCLLALGQRGLWQWEQLLAEQQERPLTSQQRHLALLLGLTASALLALQPADVDPLALEAAVASAEARLAAPPAQLLEQVQQRAAPSSEEQQPLSGAASDAGETASGSVTPTPQAVVAASTAKAAAAAVLRFHGLLTSAADAQHLQPLLPGMDVAAALAGGSEGRRALVLQLAAAAGKPPGAAMPPPEAAVVDPNARSTSGQSSQAAASPVRKLGRSMLQRRPSSRKREEAAAAGREHSAAEAARAAPGGSAAWQLSAGAAGDRVQQALQLASKWQVPAWQVHLACVESLLLHSQQQWQAGGTAAQLLGASVPPLLAGQEQAMAMLQALLLRVWPKCSSQWQQHLVEVLQLMQQCSTALAAAEAVAAGSGRGEHWQLAAALFAACQAAEQLVQAAGSIDAKGFLQPVLMLLAAELAADGNEAAAALSTGAQQLATDAAALGQQLMQHVSSSNASQLAGAVGQLKQQHSVAAAAAAAAAAAGAAREDAAPAGACYPCSGSTAYLALFCKSIARQGPRAGPLDAAALQQCQQCLQHMSPAHAAAAAAFAVAGVPCPLPLPADAARQLAVAAMSPQQQEQLLVAALAALDSGDAAAAVAADAGLLLQVQQLRQQHALLAACRSIGAACPRVTTVQSDAVQVAAQALQQQPAGASSDALGDCLQRLITTGCSAASVLQAAAVLQALQQQPQQAPPAADTLLSQPAAAAAAQEAAAAAAEEAALSALHAMSGSSGGGASRQQQQHQQQQLSPGDAVQNLFALLRSLHHQPDAAAISCSSGPEVAAAAAAAVGQAVDALRLLVWQLLQQKAASYDGSGSAAETEAHLQVLELLGSVGSSSMWPGWQPPSHLPSASTAKAGGAAAASPGSKHQRALLFTRTAAALAADWPSAVQQCRLAAADFADAEAADAALMRLAAAAGEAGHLRVILRLLLDVLPDDALPPAAAGAEPAVQPPVQPAVAPLHRAWAACLRALLALGDLAGVLAALDERQAQQTERQQEPGQLPVLLTQQEAKSLAEAADATQGVAAAAAVSLLLPYPQLQRARWQQLLQACGGSGGAADLAAALPGLAVLLMLVLQQQPGLLTELPSGGRQQHALFQQLAAAALLQQQQAEGGAYIHGLGGGLTLRTAVAAAGAAALAAGRQYTAAAWLAMQASGTPRLLRVLDSGPRVLQQLLRSCAPGSSAAAAAVSAADGLVSSGAPCTAAALLRGLPQACGAALAQLEGDLGLQR